MGLWADYYEGYWERYKIRVVLGVIVLVFVSMAMSCQELRYMTFGKVADAKMMGTHVEKDKDRFGNVNEKRLVDYGFLDGQNFRREYATVPMDWSYNAPTIKVQYLSGKDLQSRLSGTRYWGWIAVFIGSVVVAVIGVILLAREG